MGLNWSLHQDNTSYLIVKAPIKDGLKGTSIVRKGVEPITEISSVTSFSAVDQQVLEDEYIYVSIPSGTADYTSYFSTNLFTLDYDKDKPVVLAGNSDKKDILYEQDGQWYKRKVWETDVVLDGSLGWSTRAKGTGLKTVQTSSSLVSNISSGIQSADTYVRTDFYITKFDDKPLNNVSTAGSGLWGGTAPSDSTNIDEGYILISVSNSDTGFTEAMTPTADQIKAYFNGWKYTGDGTTHSWVSLVDGSAPSTNTIDYVKANKATNFTPYKLTYQLATPVIEPVTVEGDLSIQGDAQIEVGSGFSYTTDEEGNRTYTLTPANQRYAETCNLTEVKASYSSSLKSSFHSVVAKQSDIATDTSILKRQMLDVLIRLDAVENGGA